MFSFLRVRLPFLLSRAPEASVSPQILGRRLAELYVHGVPTLFSVFSDVHPQNTRCVTYFGEEGVVAFSDDITKREYIRHIAKLFDLFEQALKSAVRASTPDSELELVLRVAGTNRKVPSSKARAERVATLVERLRKAALPPESAREYSEITNRMSFSDFSKLALPAIDVTEFLNALKEMEILPPGSQFLNDEVVVSNPLYFVNLATALNGETSEGAEILSDYLLASFLDSSAKNLGGPWWNEYASNIRATQGSNVPERNETCAIRAREFVPWIFGHAFVEMEKDTADIAKHYATELLADVRIGLRNRLRSFMDPSTLAEALKKESAIAAHVGYPEWLLDRNETATRIMEMYGIPVGIAREMTVLGSEMRQARGAYPAFLSQRFATSSSSAWPESLSFLIFSALQPEAARHAWSDLGREMDSSLWMLTPDEPNAYYALRLNQIVVPLALLRPPFLYFDSAEASFGALGAILAHELTHAFDDQGSTIDSAGSLRTWWQPETRSQFELKSECFATQAANELAWPRGPHVNGRLVLGENIADTGGLALVLEQSPSPITLAAFAQLWCAHVRPETRKIRTLHDPHAPPALRVVLPFRNVPGVSDILKCPSTATYFPSGKDPLRCNLW